jgi:glycosyltransferase involved in cell wall biosynthesis
MRIGFFSPTINRIGGGEWVTINMINSLKSVGHEVVVYSAEKIDGNRIFQVFGHKLSFDDEAHFWPYIFDPYDGQSIYENALKSFMFKFKCNLLIDTFSNTLLPWNDVVYFQGGALVSYFPKGLKSLFYMPFRKLSEAFGKSYKNRDKIAMTCSQFSAKWIEEVTGHHIGVLYPPVSNFFRAYNVHADSRTNMVVTVSRLSKEKCLETVPRIAKLTSNNISFVIAGSCRSIDALVSIQNRIRELGVEKRVKLMPNISRKTLKALLHRSKVYLHTAENEPFGVSIVEAMSSGCIPVVHDSGGPKEFVPEHLRYNTAEQAALLAESSMSRWSPKKAEVFIRISDDFSEEKFSERFIEVIKSKLRSL